MNVWKVKNLIDEETFPCTFLTCYHYKSDISSWKSLKKFNSFRIQYSLAGLLLKADQLNYFSILSWLNIFGEFDLIVSGQDGLILNFKIHFLDCFFQGLRGRQLVLEKWVEEWLSRWNLNWSDQYLINGRMRRSRNRIGSFIKSNLYRLFQIAICNFWFNL